MSRYENNTKEFRTCCVTLQWVCEKKHPENEKATRQQGGLFFSRENSSNGGLDSVKTFWTKSYEPKKGGVKQFLVNKCLYFQ